MIVKLQSSRMFVSSSIVFTITTSPCRMLPAGTTTTCPCPTRSTPRPGGATTTTRAPCPRAQTGGWRGRGHVPPRVVTSRVQTALLPGPGQQRDLRAHDPLGRPHGRLRGGGVRGRRARPVPGGCCSAAGARRGGNGIPRKCSQYLFKHGDPQSQSPVRIL